MKLKDKQAVARWDQYRVNLVRTTPLLAEDEKEKYARIEHLEKNFTKFCSFYFPSYCTSEFAAFQKRFARKVINNETIYIVRAWAREHAKSVIAGLFLPTYLMATGKLKNMLLVSHSKDNADDLLMPLMINLESNHRLINDYGMFKGLRNWEVGRFITNDGCSFRGIGAGQSPRGSRNEENRPDYILIDDIDTDEEGRNQERINKKWNWVEQALFPSMSIVGAKRFVIIGNIISKDSCVVKASRMADDFEMINILDKHGKPSWKERYTLDEVNYMLSKISYASGQKEYYNNPIVEGSVFKEMNWKKARPLKDYYMLVCYTDPSFKGTRKNDFKSTVLVGKYKDEFHIIKAFLEQTTTATMVRWHYEIMEMIGECSAYYYMEANALQDIILHEFSEIGRVAGNMVPIKGDHRKKPDKFMRIESLLEPLNRNHKLWLNEAERKNPHMQRLEEQFKAMAPGMSSHDDGPDATEGGVWMINNKIWLATPMIVGKRKRSKGRY